MVEIFNPRIDDVPGTLPHDSRYHFTVTYSASFDPAEMSDTFREFVRLREEDILSPDDEIAASFPAGNTFRPNLLPNRADTRPGHQGMRVVDRAVKFALSPGAVNTELGNEEIYGEIWLRSSGNLASTGPEGSDSGLARTNIGEFPI
ncbi:hypothetical protein Pth03_34480 [Planotetraspora thailandica]|uniref:Uncharacterized protein n=1 Tax=Planotetraspora thailandica TaxID=487172 RepID=A0A8J3UZR4_9ACTN|nr:hypothetical protein [Planotetraspora thailandica]GII55059.1 hypothetical protein Pth03_34480 [Planotetraspora thailandica]